MFDLVDRLVGFGSDLLQAHPDQDGTSDMIADDAGFATLAAFQARELLGLAMKLLDLPAPATRFLCSQRVILSQVVGNDIIRALWRQHYRNSSTLCSLGKRLILITLPWARSDSDHASASTCC